MPSPPSALVGPVLWGLAVLGLALLGVVAARLLPRPWRSAVTAGAAASAVLLVAIPTLGGAGTQAPLVPLALLWWLLLTGTVSRVARDRRRGRPGPPPS